tara:strand:+ start:1068 stop:1409 length:342 start_codon:yes stop_codon:yes gene_type:complete
MLGIISSISIIQSEHIVYETNIVQNSINIAEDIAGLAVVCKKSKDPELLKEIIKKLVLDIVNITNNIIEKRKQKKLAKMKYIDDIDYIDNSQDHVDNIVNNILRKIEIMESAL